MSKTLDKLFETYAYDSRQKTQLRLADEKGLDISKMKDPKFNWEQMREISLAMEYGLTPDTLCDPEISAESMEKIRYSLMDQQSVFEDAKEEIKKKRTQRISLTIFIMVFAFIVSVVYLMNKDKIDKYIEPVLLELTTDRVTVEYGEDIHFMDYVKYYDKSQQLTIPLNEKLKKVNDYKFVYSVTNGIKTKEKALIVSVVDNIKPTIELIQSEITLNNGEQFNPKDYIKKVEDNYDQLSADNVVINNSVDSNKDGDYEVEYQLEDQQGNVAISTLIVHIRTVSQNEDNTAVGNKEDSAVIKNQEQNNKSNKVETPKAINVEPKIFYIRDYNYDLSSCSQAANNYMNQVLSSSNINLSCYIEPYQENGGVVGYKVVFD
ncbi:immunoglobulin-like domain-containing protein [Faecalibacillus intestinalis]|uniref:immunoglobulin-like domain-containing protein n=2 Tax=Faecalibacillus intestinalis TaxID=1982626 RepID=UPI00399C3927